MFKEAFERIVEDKNAENKVKIDGNGSIAEMTASGDIAQVDVRLGGDPKEAKKKRKSFKEVITKPSVNEGVSTKINTEKGAKAFAKIMNSKITKKDLSEFNSVYYDDDLLDDIDDVFRDTDEGVETQDMRYFIAKHIKNGFFSPFDDKQWLLKWDPKAIKIVDQAVSKGYKSR